MQTESWCNAGRLSGHTQGDHHPAEEARVTDTDMERRERCFDAMFREHVTGVASYCRWRSGSPCDGQDAVGEVFLIAWRRLDEVPRGEQARPWLYATARRVMANQARANARRGRLRERLRAQPSGAASEDDGLSRRVHEALAALGPRDRETLLLAEWEGLTPAEIAVIVERPAVAVRSRLHRARRRFRAAFESQAPSADADVTVLRTMAPSRPTTFLS
jgi:RNA polymerase sigma factor (sigma-70 family)